MHILFIAGWTNSPYSISKLMLNGLVRIFSKKTENGVVINACCPGVCQTELGGKHATKTPEQGAILPTDLALLPAGPYVPNGAYFSDA